LTSGFFRLATDGVKFSVRVTPKASRNEISGLYRAGNGEMSLAVKVSAAPDKGRANEAVIEVLADALALPRSRVQIVTGATSRNKLVHVSGDSRSIAEGLETLAKKLEK